MKTLSTLVLSIASVTQATAQQVSCISNFSNGFFGSTQNSTCYVGPNKQVITEGQTLIIDRVTYTMLNGNVKTKADFSKPKYDLNTCKVESYADKDGAGSKIICDGKVIIENRAK